MSDSKTYPTHKISFAEKTQDGRGNEKLGTPVDVATVWPRKNGKQGGIIEWHISPQSLKDGAYFILENERQKVREEGSQDQFERVDAKQSSVQEQGRER